MAKVENIHIGEQDLATIDEKQGYYLVSWPTHASGRRVRSAFRRLHLDITNDSSIPNDGALEKMFPSSVMVFGSSEEGIQSSLSSFLNPRRFRQLLSELKSPATTVRVNTMHGDFLYDADNGDIAEAIRVASHLDLSRHISGLMVKTHPSSLKDDLPLIIEQLRAVCLRCNIKTADYSPPGA